VVEVTVDPQTGKTSGGLHFVAPKARRLHRPRQMAVAAPTLESARLLAVEMRLYPNGLANSSGHVSPRIFASTSWGPNVYGQARDLVGSHPLSMTAARRPSTSHGSIISEKHPKFIRGYGLKAERFQNVSRGYGQARFWSSFKEGQEEQVLISMGAFGEVLARFETLLISTRW
jgi:hypothetical protein